MGRKRTRISDPTTDYDGDEDDEARVEERLGLTKQVCTDCNVTNSETADKCRSCGCTKLREKARNYRGGASNNSG